MPCEIRPCEVTVFDFVHSNCTADCEEEAVSSFFTPICSFATQHSDKTRVSRRVIE